MICKVHKLLFQEDESEEVFDLSLLKNLEKGTFCLKHCINYHSLGNLKELEISYCTSITDVSCFRNIPKLKLIACINLSDISSLGHCIELDLSYNDGITDVSALGNVHTLCLTSCENVEDVSSLQNVHTLDISGCFSITDTSGLKSVVNLNAWGCFNLENVPKLPSLEALNISGCGKINDLSGVVSLKKLSADRTTVLQSNNLPVIAKLSELSIDGNLLFINDDKDYFSEEQTTSIFDSKNLQCLEHIPTMKIFSSVNFVEFPSLQFLRFLVLSGCNEFTSLPLLPSLGYLEISICNKLETLDILGTPDLKYPIYEMKIYYCPALVKLSFHRKISRCTITECKELETFEVLSSIDLLKLNQSIKLQKIINKSLIVCLILDKETQLYYLETDIEFEYEDADEAIVEEAKT
jgi:hypothetical protein